MCKRKKENPTAPLHLQFMALSMDCLEQLATWTGEESNNNPKTYLDQSTVESIDMPH
jgi:hypothetical protein